METLTIILVIWVVGIWAENRMKAQAKVTVRWLVIALTALLLPVGGGFVGGRGLPLPWQTWSDLLGQTHYYWPAFLIDSICWGLVVVYMVRNAQPTISVPPLIQDPCKGD